MQRALKEKGLAPRSRRPRLEVRGAALRAEARTPQGVPLTSFPGPRSQFAFPPEGEGEEEPLPESRSDPTDFLTLNWNRSGVPSWAPAQRFPAAQTSLLGQRHLGAQPPPGVPPTAGYLLPGMPGVSVEKARSTNHYSPRLHSRRTC